MSRTRTVDRIATRIGHALTNSSHKVSESQVIYLGLSGHDLIFCARKTQKPKSHEHDQMLVQSLKHYAIEDLKNALKKNFPDYLKCICRIS